MEETIRLYLEGKTIREVSKITGIHKSSIFRHLKKLGITRNVSESRIGLKLSDEHKNAIKLGMSKAENVGTPPREIQNKGITDDLAYILGVMYGDGYIMKQGGIGLEVKDFDFIEEFKKITERQFGIIGNIYDGKHSSEFKDWRNGKTYERQPTKIIRFGSRLISDYIIKIKNFETVKLFTKTQKILFLRGLWDSEGSINIHKTHPTLNFTHNSEELIKIFTSLLLEVSGINMKYYQKTEQRNFIAYIQHRELIKKFYEIIQPTIKRKRMIFEEIINSLNIPKP